MEYVYRNYSIIIVHVHRTGGGAPAESSVDYVARKFMCPLFNGRAGINVGPAWFSGRIRARGTK